MGAEAIASLFASDLAKGKGFTGVKGAQRRTAEMREDEPADIVLERLARHIQNGRVPANTSCKADRPVPAGSFGKHQVCVRGPFRARATLRSRAPATRESP